VELQRQYEDLQRRGIGLAAISYDSTATLKKFAAARGITFPLIADANSAIIKRYGIFNTTVEPGSRSYGIPFPGTFMLDAKGVVRTRYFEDAYQERNTAASILVREGATATGPLTTAETRHLRIAASLSDDEVAPGERLTIVYEITPERGMHLYAPGKHDYQVINVALDPQTWLKAHPLSYPASEIYHFKPLDERVAVFMKPFRLMQDITILATPDVQKLLANEKSLTITGRVNYQACDDAVCYNPASVPLRWTVSLRPIIR
jgi:hypothetical protein